jgi:plasmid stability protein
MGQVLVRSVDDDALEFFRLRAKLNGTSTGHEIRTLIEGHGPCSPEERVAMSRYFRSRTKPGPALTLDEIREGLE